MLTFREDYHDLVDLSAAGDLRQSVVSSRAALGTMEGIPAEVVAPELARRLKSLLDAIDRLTTDPTGTSRVARPLTDVLAEPAYRRSPIAIDEPLLVIRGKSAIALRMHQHHVDELRRSGADNGTVASAEQLRAATVEFHKQHPEVVRVPDAPALPRV